MMGMPTARDAALVMLHFRRLIHDCLVSSVIIARAILAAIHE
jgi:hypothetical protein